MRLVVSQEAEDDMRSSVRWYEMQQKRLGALFLSETEAVLNRIERNPLLFQEVYKKVRRAPLRKFPFVVYYTAGASTVRVVAVLHSARRPDTPFKRYADT